ncbi:Phosphotransferase [[Candida] zeylanoides]
MLNFTTAVPELAPHTITKELDSAITETTIDSDSSGLSLSGSSHCTPRSSSALSSLSIDTIKVIEAFKHDTSPSEMTAQIASVLQSYNEALSQNSPIAMLPNYNIQPTGHEHGNFLAIDLGGSTLRVAVVQINCNNAIYAASSRGEATIITETKWSIANKFKVIDMGFFKWVAARIAETLWAQHVIDTRDSAAVIKTGLTWSFPLDQRSHNNGKIQYMGKGYTVSPEIYNQDLKSLLESALREEFRLKIDIAVLINDSLAVYAAGSFMVKNMKLALVLGTGFNFCCAIRASSQLNRAKVLSGQDVMLLNCEASLFGNRLAHALATKYDSIIDERVEHLSFVPHMEVDPQTNTVYQPSELMTSGRYLPELTRLVVCDLIAVKEIFEGVPSHYLTQTFGVKFEGFSGKLMCYIAENFDTPSIAHYMQQSLAWDATAHISDRDVQVLKMVVDSVLERGAYVVAVMIVAAIKLIGQHRAQNLPRELNIGYVGSVLEYFHSYRGMIVKFINTSEDIRKMGLAVDLKSVAHSSIVGAAVGAAYYSSRGDI